VRLLEHRNWWRRRRRGHGLLLEDLPVVEPLLESLEALLQLAGAQERERGQRQSDDRQEDFHANRAERIIESRRRARKRRAGLSSAVLRELVVHARAQERQLRRPAGGPSLLLRLAPLRPPRVDHEDAALSEDVEVRPADEDRRLLVDADADEIGTVEH